MEVKILHSFKPYVQEGEIYEAKRYWIDPSKITLLKRIPDGYEPQVNMYDYEVEILE